MKIYQNLFRFGEHCICISKINTFSINNFCLSYISYKMAKMLPTFLFRVSRNCEIFAQISISCFAKFEGNFAKQEIKNFLVSNSYRSQPRQLFRLGLFERKGQIHPIFQLYQITRRHDLCLVFKFYPPPPPTPIPAPL